MAVTVKEATDSLRNIMILNFVDFTPQDREDIVRATAQIYKNLKMIRAYGDLAKRSVGIEHEKAMRDSEFLKEMTLKQLYSVKQLVELRLTPPCLSK